MKKNSRDPNHKDFLELTSTKQTNKYSFFHEEKAEQRIGKRSSKAFGNSKEALHAALPFVTGMGIQMMGDRGGLISFAPLGLPVALGGVIIDAIKAPICLTVAGEEALRGLLLKCFSFALENSPQEEQKDRIYKSFQLRLKATADLLIGLGLENKENIENKLHSGAISDLIGLTLLNTAYASRELKESLCLANGKTLSRENCPMAARRLFDEIMEIKSLLNAALHAALPGKKSEEEEAKVVCHWIRLIKEGKNLTITDKPNATEAQIKLVNDIIERIADLQELAKEYLPESTESLGNRISLR